MQTESVLEVEKYRKAWPAKARLGIFEATFPTDHRAVSLQDSGLRREAFSTSIIHGHSDASKRLIRGRRVDTDEEHGDP
jgi:hypothetical protein